jgi:hypothetical protein
VDTLEEIRQGRLKPQDLPPIQVLVGPPVSDNDDDDRWYFSLNNRRLWVLKQCRAEGLLSRDNNKIRVRVRTPKSKAEAERYTLEKCSLDAKFLRESNKKSVSVSSLASKTSSHHQLEENSNAVSEVTNKMGSAMHIPDETGTLADVEVLGSDNNSNDDDESATSTSITPSSDDEDSDEDGNLGTPRRTQNAFSVLR